jgi:hypothetical protein
MKHVTINAVPFITLETDTYPIIPVTWECAFCPGRRRIYSFTPPQPRGPKPPSLTSSPTA